MDEHLLEIEALVDLDSKEREGMIELLDRLDEEGIEQDCYN